MKSQLEYWEHFIIDWDQSVYNKDARNLSLLEQLASKFRGPLRARHQLACNFLAPLAEGRKILEIGCGTGRLSYELLKAGAHSITGIDISQLAIDKANSVFSDKFSNDQFCFLAGELEAIDFSELEFDTVIGLGILQYMAPTDMHTLFKKKIGSCQLFFEFHESKPTLLNGLHWIYRSMKQTLYSDYPHIRPIPRSEIRGLVDEAYYCHIPGASFFTTFPSKDWAAL
jgi:SAM-dependent methyltransferase